MKKLVKAIHCLSGFIKGIAVYAILIMIVLTVIDVYGRYLFNSPLKGTQDILEVLLVIIVYGGMASASHERAHIRADLFNSLLRPRTYAILTGCCFILALIAAAIWAWQVTIQSWIAIKQHSIHVTPTIGLPTAPFYTFAAFGLVLLSLEMIIDIARYFAEAKQGQEKAESDIPEEKLVI